MTAKIFNVSALRLSTDGNRAFEQALLAEFENTVNRCISKLTPQCEEAEWHDRLHELRGSAASMGAEALTNACKMGEKSNTDRHHYLQALRQIVQETLEAMHAEISPQKQPAAK